MTEIRVPALGESVTEATIGKWFKKPGDKVAVDEPLVELETDKVTIEVPAPSAGTLGESVTEATIGRWFKKAGDAVAVDEPLVELETDKVTIEVPAPSAGVLGEISAKEDRKRVV